MILYSVVADKPIRHSQFTPPDARLDATVELHRVGRCRLAVNWSPVPCAWQVRAMSFSDIWRILDDLLDQGRSSHCRRYAESRHPHCLLCCPRSFACRQTLGGKSRPSTGPTAAPGFVDLSCPHHPHHRHAAVTGGGNSTSGSDTPPTNTLLMNGHITGVVILSSFSPSINVCNFYQKFSINALVLSTFIIIDRIAGEIIRLVVSVCPRALLCLNLLTFDLDFGTRVDLDLG